MHRVIMQPDKGFDVSHRDGNKLHNQRANLMIVARSDNAHRVRRRNDNTSGYKGVWYDRHRAAEKKAPWRAQVLHQGKRYMSPRFWTAVEPAVWYNETARALFGESAYQNSIDYSSLK